MLQLSRRVLRIRGRDGRKLLQGLVTGDVEQGFAEHDAFFTAFLNAKGRILYDAIAQRAGDDEILLDVDQAMAPYLLRHLKMYKLRSKVKISDASDEFSVAVQPPWGARFEGHDVDSAQGEVHRFVDPRAAALGQRVLLEGPAPDSAAAGDQRFVDWMHLAGVLPAQRQMDMLPLECNLELLNGVSFGKGCYVGQELTARTQFKGVIRKRVVPVLLGPAGGPPAPPLALPLGAGVEREGPWASWQELGYDAPELDDADRRALCGAVAAGDPITVDGDGAKAKGKVLSVAADIPVALALLRLDALWDAEGAAQSVALSVGGGKAQAVPLVPGWWPGTLEPGSGKMRLT